MFHNFKCLVDTNTRHQHNEEHQRHPFCEYLNLSKINESREIWQIVFAIGKIVDASILREHILQAINCTYGPTVILIWRSGISCQLRINMKTDICPNSLYLHRYFLLFSPFIRTVFFIEAPAEIQVFRCNMYTQYNLDDCSKCLKRTQCDFWLARHYWRPYDAPWCVIKSIVARIIVPFNIFIWLF